MGSVKAVEVTTGYNDGGLDDRGVALPTQADAIVKGVGGTSVIEAPNPSGGADLMQVGSTVWRVGTVADTDGPIASHAPQEQQRASRADRAST